MSAPVIDDDMFASEVIDDPYTYYGHLREIDPVHWNDLHKVWIVTRYDDVIWITRNPEMFSSAVPQKDKLPPYPPINPQDQQDYEYVQHHQTGRIITADRPPHRDMRAVLMKFFSPGAMETWRPMIRRAVDGLLDDLIDNGRMDVVRDFAVPLPLLVISEMMGVPKADRRYVRQLAEKLLIGPSLAPGRMRDIADSMRAMDSYVTPLLEERLECPGDDLISLLGEGEKRGIYSRAQVLQNAAFLIVAGHETSINLICNGLLAFIRHPAQWQRLREDPEGLAGPATEECLRYDPPVKSIERIAVTDIELRGRQIRELDRVRWFIASANRDPERFENPDTFDIDRSPNQHVGFGHGIHMCLGATLARIEGQEVFRAFAQRIGSLRLETDPIRYAAAAHLRSLKELEVSW